MEAYFKITNNYNNMNIINNNFNKMPKLSEFPEGVNQIHIIPNDSLFDKELSEQNAHEELQKNEANEVKPN